MSYIFKGKLWDKTETTLEPISNVIIKLYKPQKLTLGKTAKRTTSKLIAESKTDDNGNFIIEINKKFSNGTEFEVDVFCEKISDSAFEAGKYEMISFRSLTINPGRSKLKMESFKMGTITFLSIFGAG